MNNNTILAIALLMAGTLLTTTAVTTMVVPAAYADNKQKAEDDSAAALADCDDNEVERAEFECIDIALNNIGVDLGNILNGLTELGDSTETAAQFTEEQ